jgi:hypothetical protein
VTGAVMLGGVLELEFSQGFAPKQGDSFTFLTATGGVSGAFDRVEIKGLLPGFAYDLTYSSGQLALAALNDGIPDSGAVLRRVFLPLATR